jgi:hypothetical protein
LVYSVENQERQSEIIDGYILFLWRQFIPPLLTLPQSRIVEITFAYWAKLSIHDLESSIMKQNATFMHGPKQSHISK